MSLAIPKSAIFTTRPVAFVVNRQFLQSKVQGDQVNMAVFVLYLVKSVVFSVHAYNGRVTFYKVPEKHSFISNKSPLEVLQMIFSDNFSI